MATLAEIRAKLKEQESRTGGSQSSGGDNAIFPFWNSKKDRLLQLDSFQMEMNPIHFSGKNV